LAVTELVVAQSGARPGFQDFAVKKIFRGAPAAPKLVTKDQKLFRTMIRQGARSKVEFAGHYTVPRWGCGAGCSDFVIVDSISGRIYDGFATADFPLEWFDEHSGTTMERVEFRPESRLFKINGCPSERDCGFYDYEMVDGEGLKLVRKELLPKNISRSRESAVTILARFARGNHCNQCRHLWKFASNGKGPVHF
jgi:hypothetical protein